MEQGEYCKCKVKIQNGGIFAYYCDENGNHVGNFSKHLQMNSLLSKIRHDGWEIISFIRPNSTRIIYTLKRT